MSCITNDLILDCLNTARAGFSRVFLSCACSIDSFEASGVNHSFTSVTMDNSVTDLWYEYEAEVETKTLSGEGALSEVGGTPSQTYTFEFKFIGINKTNLFRLQELIDSRKITAIIESPNSTGTYNQAFVLGWDNVLGADAAARPNANLLVEGNFDGENSATIILTAKHAELIREYVGSIETYNQGVTTTVNFGS